MTIKGPTGNRHAPNGAIILNFGMWGVIADVITHANFFVNQFRGLGVLTPRNFAISIGLAGRSYNVLHCDITRLLLNQISRCRHLHITLLKY